ncbi:MAG: hypothetical protein GTN76_08270, partial [Candidatus Aenigmarchaeota archaeon]|nr:hypothetical protein [Candidatus Aenigmarchaeota archaeon]
MADGTKKNKEKSEKNNYRKKMITINSLNETTVTVPIESGGSIEFPPGSLPEGTGVIVEKTRMPILPEYAEAVGEALRIEADGDILNPVWLRILIPQGVVDPSTLAIFRVENSGVATQLMTEVEGIYLVAATPGLSTPSSQGNRTLAATTEFAVSSAEKSKDGANPANSSTFAVGKVPPEYKFQIVGPSSLLPGGTAVYSVSSGFSVTNEKWEVTGPFRLIEKSGGTAIIRANEVNQQETGMITLAFFDDFKGGWLYSTPLSVLVEPDMAVDSYWVDLTTLTP